MKLENIPLEANAMAVLIAPVSIAVYAGSITEMIGNPSIMKYTITRTVIIFRVKFRRIFCFKGTFLIFLNV